MSEQNDIIVQISTAVSRLLENNSDRIKKIINDSQSHKLAIGIRASIYSSGSAPEAKVTIRYTPERVADSLVIHGEDPNQLGLCIHNPDAEDTMSEPENPKTPGRRGRPPGSKNKKKSKNSEPVSEQSVEPPTESAPEPTCESTV